MKKKITFSFIIPVYQVEKYIKECIRSILGCIREGDEILLIIRDKKDKSYKICREFMQKYKEITLILQDKTGLSNARNCGLKKAKGDYIVFADGDDYIKTSNFKKRRALLEQLSCEMDVLASDFIGINHDGKEYHISHQIPESAEIITKEYFAKYSQGLDSYWNVWRYFYRREFLRKENLYFLEDIQNEDVDFTTRVFLKAKKIGYYHKPYYCYRTRRKGALTSEKEKEHIRDLLQIIESNMEICKKADTLVSRCLIQKLIREYLWNLPFLYEVPKTQREEVYDMYKKTQYLIKENKKGRIVQISDKIGIRLSAGILYLLKKTRRRIRRIE